MALGQVEKRPRFILKKVLANCVPTLSFACIKTTSKFFSILYFRLIPSEMTLFYVLYL